MHRYIKFTLPVELQSTLCTASEMLDDAYIRPTDPPYEEVANCHKSTSIHQQLAYATGHDVMQCKVWPNCHGFDNALQYGNGQDEVATLTVHQDL